MLRASGGHWDEEWALGGGGLAEGIRTCHGLWGLQMRAGKAVKNQQALLWSLNSL